MESVELERLANFCKKTATKSEQRDVNHNSIIRQKISEPHGFATLYGVDFRGFGQFGTIFGLPWDTKGTAIHFKTSFLWTWTANETLMETQKSGVGL